MGDLWSHSNSPWILDDDDSNIAWLIMILGVISRFGIGSPTSPPAEQVEWLVRMIQGVLIRGLGYQHTGKKKHTGLIPTGKVYSFNNSLENDGKRTCGRPLVIFVFFVCVCVCVGGCGCVRGWVCGCVYIYICVCFTFFFLTIVCWARCPKIGAYIFYPGLYHSCSRVIPFFQVYTTDIPQL